MEKTLATLEISASAVKLVLGYELDGLPIVLYANKVELTDALTNGEISNPEIITNAIKTLIQDVKVSLGYDIGEVVLALPAIDLEVYSGTQTTNTLSSKIERIDIKNVLSMFRKNRVDPNKTIISVLPQVYKTENEQVYRNLPLNEPSNSLTIDAFLHILPLWIYNSYIEIVAKSGIRVTKVYADKYALTELLNHESYGTSSYFLVDYGAKNTSISFVLNHNLYFNRIMPFGSEHLTDALAEKYGLERPEAEKLKINFGLDRRNINVNIALAEGVDANGKIVKVSLDNIYETCKEFSVNHLNKIVEEIKIIEKTQNITEASKYPLIFVGGGSKLYGLDQVLASNHTFAEKYILKLTTLGARDLVYAVNLGLIKAYSKYMIDIGDERSSVGSLTRS